jgi:hypothetical protein
MSNEIKRMPLKQGLKEIAPAQGSLDLAIVTETIRLPLTFVVNVGKSAIN